MKEITILSGKGGTGKTSLAVSLAVLAARSAAVVVADCDVDAPDVHLLLQPSVRARHDFIQGHQAVIDQELCTDCGVCQAFCRFEAIHPPKPQGQAGGGTGLGWHIDGCEGCGVCVSRCPRQAIRFEPRFCGNWYESDTRLGALLHARLEPGGENSGKLVSLLRERARDLAGEQGAGFVMVDGSPGTGCPVIAALSSTNFLLLVAEPGLASIHDLERVIALGRHFRVRMGIVINRWDINPALSTSIEQLADVEALPVLGRIPWDRSVTAAQRVGLSVVEYAPTAKAAQAMEEIWKNLQTMLS